MNTQPLAAIRDTPSPTSSLSSLPAGSPMGSLLPDPSACIVAVAATTPSTQAGKRVCSHQRAWVEGAYGAFPSPLPPCACTTSMHGLAYLHVGRHPPLPSVFNRLFPRQFHLGLHLRCPLHAGSPSRCFPSPAPSHLNCDSLSLPCADRPPMLYATSNIIALRAPSSLG